MEAFFAALVREVGKIVKDILAEDGSVTANLDVCQKKECRDQSNSSHLYKQCQHCIPAVCMTKVGVGLNVFLNGIDLFTVDLVPSFNVKVRKNFTELSLRQSITRYLLGDKPPGWYGHLRKYLTEDGLFLSEFKSNEEKQMCVNLKVINWDGQLIVKPGLIPGMSEILKDPGIKQCYIILKVLKTITKAKAKSYTCLLYTSDAADE